MNTPTLETERLILRKFTEDDLEAIYQIYSDEEVNQFLPWFPLRSLEEARLFFREKYASNYARPQAYAYVVCLKEDNIPIGYINVGIKYQYSYEEDWQPKGILVTFCMYQLNLDGQKDRVYKKYWDNAAVRFI